MGKNVGSIPFPRVFPATSVHVFVDSDDEIGMGYDNMEDVNNEGQEAPLKTFTRAKLNVLFRDRDLSKNALQLILSGFDEKNLLAPGTMFAFYRYQENDTF